MISLVDLLCEGRSETLALMPKFYDEVMSKYLEKYMDHQLIFLNSPTFAVKSHPRHLAWFDPGRSIIYISTQAAEYGSEKEIKELIYHEAIHYVQTCIGADRSNPHGRFFEKCMNEINAGEGYECVTITGEEIKHTTEQPFRIIGFKTSAGDYYFGRVPRPANLEMDLSVCKKFAKKYGAKIMFSFLTDQGYFKRKLPSISGKTGGMASFYKSQVDPEEYDKLCKLADENQVDMDAIPDPKVPNLYAASSL